MKTRTARTDNKGLTVKLNFWPMAEKRGAKFNATGVRQHIMGAAYNFGTDETIFFRDPGALLTILSDWNLAQFKKLRRGGGR